MLPIHEVNFESLLLVEFPFPDYCKVSSFVLSLFTLVLIGYKIHIERLEGEGRKFEKSCRLDLVQLILVSMGDVKTLVEAKIAGKKVMVFSKSYCPYCTMAKKALKKYLGKELSPEDYEIMELDGAPNGPAIQSYLQKKTGASSVSFFFGFTCFRDSSVIYLIQK